MSEWKEPEWAQAAWSALNHRELIDHPPKGLRNYYSAGIRAAQVHGITVPCGTCGGKGSVWREGWVVGMSKSGCPAGCNKGRVAVTQDALQQLLDDLGALTEQMTPNRAISDGVLFRLEALRKEWEALTGTRGEGEA